MEFSVLFMGGHSWNFLSNRNREENWLCSIIGENNKAISSTVNSVDRYLMKELIFFSISPSPSTWLSADAWVLINSNNMLQRLVIKCHVVLDCLISSISLLSLLLKRSISRGVDCNLLQLLIMLISLPMKKTEVEISCSRVCLELVWIGLLVRLFFVTERSKINLLAVTKIGIRDNIPNTGRY